MPDFLTPTYEVPGSFDAIMEETWEWVGDQRPQDREAGLYANGRLVWALNVGDALNRPLIAALGKDALALIPELEWSRSDYDQGYDEYLAACPICGGNRPGQHSRRKNTTFGHSPNCALGTLCERLRGLSKAPPPPERPRPAEPRTSWEMLDDEEPKVG